jgi:DNA repair exonuclease SbcCD ATPase subunit
MVRTRMVLPMIVVACLALVAAAQPNAGPDSRSPTEVSAPRAGQPMGTQPPAPRMRQRAQELRARAQEAQRLADQLRYEANELDRQAQGRPQPGPGPRPGDTARIDRELGELKEAIGRAEQEGRSQDAAELRERADRLKGQLRPLGHGMGEPREVQERIERLRNESRKAKEQGRFEDSQRLWQEADNLQMKIQQGQEIGSMDERLRMMREKAAALREQADRAQREGREREAWELRENAGRVERDAEEGMRKIERMKVEGRLKQLDVMADQARQGGDFRRADALDEEARQLKQRLGGSPTGPQPREEELLRAVEGLKLEIMQLRQEVDELKNRLNQRPQ